ncbi:unnamed protein product, partial [Mesorhabditis spiculigera]
TSNRSQKTKAENKADNSNKSSSGRGDKGSTKDGYCKTARTGSRDKAQAKPGSSEKGSGSTKKAKPGSSEKAAGSAKKPSPKVESLKKSGSKNQCGTTSSLLRPTRGIPRRKNVG